MMVESRTLEGGREDEEENVDVEDRLWRWMKFELKGRLEMREYDWIPKGLLSPPFLSLLLTISPAFSFSLILSSLSLPLQALAFLSPFPLDSFPFLWVP